MTTATTGPVLTAGQALAADQINEVADLSGGAVELLSGPRRCGTGQSVAIDIAMDCSGMVSAPDGLRLRPREVFGIEVAPSFPFKVPSVRVPHTRWAGVPHVQWGNSICLYAAPAVEWQPADGMRGLLDRLVSWLRRAAAGDLDPAGQPLHPPVAYASLSAGVAVIRADLPDAGTPSPGQEAPGAGFLVAVCQHEYQERLDVIEWVTPERWKARLQSAEVSGNLDASGRRIFGSVAVLLSRDIGFEYPDEAGKLMNGLTEAGADKDRLLDLLGTVAMFNTRLDGVHKIQGHPQPARPLCLFVGTPSRRMPGSGRRMTHLVCWRMDEAERMLLAGDDRQRRDQHEIAEALAGLAGATTWIPVMESRPQVTIRRDSRSPAAWLSGKRILILGCGALGAPVAEICVRAGAAEVTVADNGVVHPGILVRQPYDDADIGGYKAIVLASRLNQIHGDQRVLPLPQDVITTVLTEDLDPAQFDLIIDAAASTAVTSRLEHLRSASPRTWPAVMTMIIGHDARRGVIAIARPGASGAGRDILRKLDLAAHGSRSAQLADIRDDLFPGEPRLSYFQPEPGCSDPTFTGSAAETTALAAHLMAAGLDALTGTAGSVATRRLTAAVVRLGESGDRAGHLAAWLDWPDDLVIRTEPSGYQIRLAQAAIREMRAETTRGERVRGRAIETGGMLLGEIDDACRCVWIDTATGPPPDSKLSASYFDHGIAGIGDLIEYHQQRSGSTTTFAGMWHTHPDHPARPSETDEAGMRHLLAQAGLTVPRALMLILGGPSSAWSTWLTSGQPPDVYVRLIKRRDTITDQSAGAPASHDHGWPGGYGKPEAVPGSQPARRRSLRLWFLTRRSRRNRAGL